MKKTVQENKKKEFFLKQITITPKTTLNCGMSGAVVGEAICHLDEYTCRMYTPSKSILYLGEGMGAGGSIKSFSRPQERNPLNDKQTMLL